MKTGKLSVRRVEIGKLLVERVITDKISLGRVNISILPIRRVITNKCLNKLDHNEKTASSKSNIWSIVC